MFPPIFSEAMRMRKALLAAAIVCFFPALLLSQENPIEIGEKLSNADRATAMKMFPALEKQNLLGVEECQVLVEGKVQKGTRLFFLLPLSEKAKSFYYCYVLKTGTEAGRLLAAENLRPYPGEVGATLEELAAQEKLDNFDLAACPLLSFASIGFNEDSSSSCALYWETGDNVAFYLLTKKLHALLATAPTALVDRSIACGDARNELIRNVALSKSTGDTKEFTEVLKTRLANAAWEAVKSDFALALASVEGNIDKIIEVLLDKNADKGFRESALRYLEEWDKPEVVEKLLGAVPKIENPDIRGALLSALRTAALKHYPEKKNCEMAFTILLDKTAPKELRVWALQLFTSCADWEALRKLVSAIASIEDEELLQHALERLRYCAFWKLEPEEKADLALAVYGQLGGKASEWMRDLLIGNAERRLAQRLYDRAREEQDESRKSLYEKLSSEVAEIYQAKERGEEGIGTERGISAALRWLYLHQDYKDSAGNWDSDGFDKNCDPKRGIACSGRGHPDYDIQVTSLSLLCFLGSGNTHQAGVFKKTVTKGLEWLKSQQQTDGSFGSRVARFWRCNQVLATLAICEAYAVTQDPRLKEYAQRAVQFLLSLQEKDGRWKKGEKVSLSDAIVTGWAVLALKAAKTGKLDVPEESFAKALLFLDSISLEREKQNYGLLESSRIQVAAASAAATFLCGRPKTDARLAKLLEILDKNPPKWDDRGGPIYWYFGTYALSLTADKERWRKWRESLRKTLLDTNLIGGCADGSWDPVGPDGKVLGRVGVTAINYLALEVYYRSRTLHKNDK